VPVVVVSLLSEAEDARKSAAVNYFRCPLGARAGSESSSAGSGSAAVPTTNPEFPEKQTPPAQAIARRLLTDPYAPVAQDCFTEASFGAEVRKSYCKILIRHKASSRRSVLPATCSFNVTRS
jgi:hypothetical protein